MVRSRGEDRYELAFRLCDSSQHSKEPSEEVFHPRDRQESPDKTWIINSHARFSDRRNVSGQSLSPVMCKMYGGFALLCDILVSA